MHAVEVDLGLGLEDGREPDARAFTYGLSPR